MSRSRTVLLVEDNEAFVDNLSEILAEEGYSVRTTGSCADGLAAAQADGFDVALVDIHLPDGDGTELAQQLKQIDIDGQVILLTGFASLESAVAAVRAGAWAYLVKTCATVDLLLSIRQAVQQVVLLEERRELARRAQVAEKLAAVGTLTAGLSHEIRNPLNAASLQLMVLERRVRKIHGEIHPSLLEPLELVQHEVKRLNQILEEFLQFARPRELQAESVEFSHIVGRVLDLLQAQADRAGVTIERRFHNVTRVAGEAARLQQAVMNLVLNALQATPHGGWVRVQMQMHAGEVELVIEDSGPGIPAELRQRVLEPFFTTKAGGSGLGLPLVHSIVQQHGGSIAIEEGEIGGARFVVRLQPSRA